MLLFPEKPGILSSSNIPYFTKDTKEKAIEAKKEEAHEVFSLDTMDMTPIELPPLQPSVEQPIAVDMPLESLTIDAPQEEAQQTCLIL
jgi:hypothetical protein